MIHFDTKLSWEEAEKLSVGIASEANHMIVKSPHDIVHELGQYGGLIARVSGDVAGITKLTPVIDGVFEVGSVYIMPEFRQYGIGKRLLLTVNEEYQKTSLLLVTNVEAVKRIMQADAKQMRCERKQLGTLLQAIEGPQALFPDDDVFANKTLFARIRNGEFDY